MAHKYLVTTKADGSQRLVEASNPGSAIAHVAKDQHDVERVGEAAVKRLGLTAEKAASTGKAPADGEAS